MGEAAELALGTEGARIHGMWVLPETGSDEDTVSLGPSNGTQHAHTCSLSLPTSRLVGPAKSVDIHYSSNMTLTRNSEGQSLNSY